MTLTPAEAAIWDASSRADDGGRDPWNYRQSVHEVDNIPVGYSRESPHAGHGARLSCSQSRDCTPGRIGSAQELATPADSDRNKRPYASSP